MPSECMTLGRVMPFLEILKYPDPLLKRKSQPVDKLSTELVALADNILKTMYHFKGIGLAAPQVGHHLRLIVIDTVWHRDSNSEELLLTDLEKKYAQPLVLFNPVIKKKEGKVTFSEGCLSVPGYYEDVQRAQYVEVEAINPQGQLMNIQTDGLLSVCLQHEIDHLDGFVFVERLSLIKRERLKSKIRKQGYPQKNISTSPKEQETQSL